MDMPKITSRATALRLSQHVPSGTLAAARLRSGTVSTTTETGRMNNTLEQIAREHLSLETLDTRNADSLDFHEHAVWCIRDALAAAYAAGLARGATPKRSA